MIYKPLQVGILLVCLTGDRKSTRLNSSHVSISYAVFCLKKKTHVVHHPQLTSFIRHSTPPLYQLDVFSKLPIPVFPSSAIPPQTRLPRLVWIWKKNC